MQSQLSIPDSVKNNVQLCSTIHLNSRRISHTRRSMFAKVFSQIFDSSIAESHLVRHIFMDLLVLADATGVVDMTMHAISRRINVPLEDVRAAIEKLASPDPLSRSEREEGRRIVLIDSHRDWGWQIVNYEHYRKTQDEDARRSYFRDYRKAERDKKRATSFNDVQVGSSVFKNVTQGEGDAEEEEKEQYSEKSGRFAEWFRTLLPQGSNLPSGFKGKWAKCYDAMIRLDKRTDDQIMAVCKWARSDSFWSSNFQSPMKLRARNPEGVQYFDVFMGKMNPATQLQKPAKSRGQCIGEAGQRYAMLTDFSLWPKRPDGTHQTPDEVGDADWKKQLPAL